MVSPQSIIPESLLNQFSLLSISDSVSSAVGRIGDHSVKVLEGQQLLSSMDAVKDFFSSCYSCVENNKVITAVVVLALVGGAIFFWGKKSNTDEEK